MDVPADYHVWATMLGHYQRHMPKLANVRPRKKTVLSTIQNDLLHDLNWQGNSFCNRLWSCVAATGGALTLRTVCLNTEWAMGIWHSWLKHLNCWWKAVKNLICYSCIFHVQLHVHLKKWTLKFKLLYLMNYISYFNKICRICWVNIRIQSLKVWRKFVLSLLRYSIFARGLFFYWRTLYYLFPSTCTYNREAITFLVTLLVYLSFSDCQ